MTVGMPVVALATTEMSTVVENGVSGWIDTDVDRLIGHMRDLLADPDEARRLGDGARRTALERFSIGRFAADWDQAFRQVTVRSGAA
jgi:glycosyltransferase involved in cell wall biosynthesis